MRARALTLCAIALAGCTAGGHAGAVVDVAFSPDRRRAVTAGLDRTLKVWDVEDGRLVATLRLEGAAAPVVAFAGDGRVVTHDGVGALRIFDIAREEEIARLPAPRASEVAVSPDAGRVALLGGDTLTLIDIEAGRALWSATLRNATPTGYKPAQAQVAFDGDGGRVLVTRVAAKDERRYVAVDIHDARTGSELRRETPPSPPSVPDPGGDRRIVGLEDGTVRCLDSASGRELWSVEGR